MGGNLDLQQSQSTPPSAWLCLVFPCRGRPRLLSGCSAQYFQIMPNFEDFQQLKS